MATWADRRDAYNAEMRGVQRQEQERRRLEEERNALADILRSAYTQGTPATPDRPYSEQDVGSGVGPLAMGAPVPGTGSPGTPGNFSMENAISGLLKGGRGDMAYKLMETMKPKQDEYTLGEIGAGNDQVQSGVFNKSTGKFEPLGQSRRKSSVPDWMMPGYVDAQKKIAEAKGEGRMSPTVQKELFEADETLQAASNVIGLLDKAKEINKTAKFGPYAKERAKVKSWLPGEDEAANATIDLDNIMTGQALESLKLIFGGMPTEGERKILLDLQASVDKTPAQREAILNRARELAERRYSFNKSKADSLRSGQYFKESPDISPQRIEGPTGPKQYKLGDFIDKGGKRYVIKKLDPNGDHEVQLVK